MTKEKTKVFLYLQLLLFFNSLGTVCSKMAGAAAFLSKKFIICYGLVLLILFVYAIVWQQILKQIPLVTAYANKAVMVIWGMLWGVLIFKEKLNVWNMIGAVVIIVGICMVVKADEK